MIQIEKVNGKYISTIRGMSNDILAELSAIVASLYQGGDFDDMDIIDSVVIGLIAGGERREQNAKEKAENGEVDDRLKYVAEIIKGMKNE